MDFLIARPTLSEDKHEELRRYLDDMWRRAMTGRQDQVDSDYARWSKVYSGTPLERERTVPFYKASNFVVKLVRIYTDTFVARTLNIIFATKPLYVVEGLPRNLKESWQYYINQKALRVWKHYKIVRTMLDRGVRNGSVVFKTLHTKDTSWEMSALDENTPQEREVTNFVGPYSQPIPFEDFYVYPTTAENGSTDPIPWKDVVIKFHRVRYPEEVAKEKFDSGAWEFKLDELDSYLTKPNDIKAMQVADESGVRDERYRELITVECYLKYSVTNDNSKQYEIVAVIHPASGELLDVYFNPYTKSTSIFTDYRPYGREGLWYGESLCEILGQSQEEASVIHNDRRNNSFISNAVCFKRRNGSLLPNPSTNWYPGKVWDLDSMDDLDVISIGRTYEDMLPQEDYVFGLADRLSGIGQTAQGSSEGQQGKHGTYNTMGTLSVMAEGNQRQDTNIRDVRDCIGSLIAACSQIQARWGSDDPFIDTLPTDVGKEVREAFALINKTQAAIIRHEVQSSSAGANSEVRKASLLQISQVLGQYGAFVQQMTPQLLNPQINPGLRAVMNDIVEMQSWMAKTLMREFDLSEATDIIPDVAKAIEGQIPGGSRGTKDSGPNSPAGGVDTGGPGDTLPPVSGQQLASIAALSPQAGGQPQ